MRRQLAAKFLKEEIKAIALAAALICGWSMAAKAASFDCAQAHDGLSATVCKDSELSVLGVWSRDEVTRVKFENFWCVVPGLADGLEGCFPLESLEVLGEIVG